MVEYSKRALDLTFSALADPTRRAILQRLREGEASVGQVAEPFRISLAAVSKHLKVLERAGLITRQVEGRTHRLALNAGPMEDALRWLAAYQEFWGESMAALAALLEEERGSES